MASAIARTFSSPIANPNAPLRNASKSGCGTDNQPTRRLQGGSCRGVVENKSHISHRKKKDWSEQNENEGVLKSYSGNMAQQPARSVTKGKNRTWSFSFGVKAHSVPSTWMHPP